MKVRSENVDMPRAIREFTDREEPRAAFWDMYRCTAHERLTGENNVRVLTYYGFGGIGKSRLLRKLMSEVDERVKKPRRIYFDFNVNQERRAVLEKIRNRLEEEYKYQFPLFDLGSYAYAQKIGEKPDSLEIKNLIGRSPILGLLLSGAEFIPVVGIATKVLSLADQGIAMLRTHLKQHSRDLTKIEYMEAEGLYDYLPYLFARDLAHNLQKETEPLVVFLDTYERVVNELSQLGDPLKNDEWIRGDHGLVQNIPGVLWVIAGREKLKWEMFDPEWADALEQHLLGSLSEADSNHFLEKAGVGGAELRGALYVLTGGVPVYLDLCVDQFLRLVARGKVPAIGMFGSNTSDLIERFIRYMGDTQKDMVYMLSCLKQWDEELIREIGGKILPSFAFSAYEKIKDFSFVIQSEEGYFHIHQTVGEVLLSNCPGALKQRVADCLMERFRQEVKEEAYFTARFITAMNYVTQAGLMKYPDDEAFRVFYEESLRHALKGLAEAGRFEQAGNLFAVLRERAEYAPESRLYACVMKDSGSLVILRGLYAEAEAIMEKVWKLYVKLLGEDHPDTIEAKGEIVVLLHGKGEYNRAFEIGKEVLEARKRVLGENHPDTIESKGNLATILSMKGEYDLAISLEEEVLEARKQVLGKEHPNTLGAKANLAHSFDIKGLYDRALSLEEEVLEERKRILGEDHPDTIISKGNLASTLQNVGEYRRAIELEEEVLEARKRILGEEHPNTLMAKANLACTLHEVGAHDGALALGRETTEAMTRILGKDHPDTLRTKLNLASTLCARGDYEQALAMAEDVLEARKRILGEDHPDTLATKTFVANTLYQTEGYQRVRSLEEEVLEARKQKQGEDHPFTIAAKENLAFTLYALGEYNRGITLAAEVLEARKRILGEDHPDTIKVKANLAIFLYNVDEYDMAIALEEEVLEARIRLLGEDHPDTVEARESLQMSLQAKERRERSLRMPPEPSPSPNEESENEI